MNKLFSMKLFNNTFFLYALLFWSFANLPPSEVSHNRLVETTVLFLADKTTQTDCTDPNLYADNCDFDDDGIDNVDDLDDDNDGILDTDECNAPSVTDNSSFTNTVDPWTLTNNFEYDSVSGFIVVYDDALGISEAYQTINTTVGSTYEFSMDLGAVSFNLNEAQLEIIFEGNVLATFLSEDIRTHTSANFVPEYRVTFSGTATQPSSTITLRVTILDGGGSGLEASNDIVMDNFEMYLTTNCQDSDNDGVPDIFDLDSDDDGCSDAFEAGATTDPTPNFQFPNIDSNNDGLVDAVDADNNGNTDYPSTYSNAIDEQINNCPPPCSDPNLLAGDCDLDADGVINDIDLDDDNDGILDTDEGFSCTEANAFQNPSAQNGMNGWTEGGLNHFFDQAVANRFFVNNSQFGMSSISQTIASFDNLNGTIQLTFRAWVQDGDHQAGGTARMNVLFNGTSYFEIFNPANQGVNAITVTAQNGATFSGPTTMDNSGGFDDALFVLSIPTTASSGTFEFQVDVIGGSKNDDGGYGEIYIANTSCTSTDTDSDNLPDHFDLDSDNDGCSDAFEAGATTDLTPNFQFPNIDSNNDGLVDAVDANNDGSTDYNSTYPNAIDEQVSNCNAPPSITNHNSDPSATTTYAENDTTPVDNYEATDPNGEAEGNGLTWSLTGGADMALLSIDPSNGDLTFNASPDFENPTDAGADNTYEVEITISDVNGLIDVQMLTINVTDQPEVELCNDGIDNDGDGQIDCEDGDCFNHPDLPDLDGDGIPDCLDLCTDDRDNDGIPDCEDLDPLGWIYYEHTGQIVQGASYTVINTDTNNDDEVIYYEDGSTGFYRWAVSAPGTYQMIITPPVGYQLSTNCLQQDPPPYDPTGQPNPVVLGNGQNANTGFLTDANCTTFYLTFDLEVGDPFVINNNIPVRPTSEIFCSDGIDNDEDGLTDCDDPDCQINGNCCAPPTLNIQKN